MKKIPALLVLVLLSSASHGLTLQEYGISFINNGLIDHTSGLRWLDSGLTEGGLDELQTQLDAGWRLATEEEFYFLLTRQISAFGGSADVPLHLQDFQAMMSRLSVTESDTGGEFSGPWLCRDYGSPQQNCSAVNSLGGQFLLQVIPDEFPVLLHLSLNLFISEVPIYGSLDCLQFPDLCSFTGRSLMVRAVPLPGALLLMFSALAGIGAALRQRQP